MDIDTMDPNILISIINMKLRDYYSNLIVLCEDMELNKEIIQHKLNSIGYYYLETQNQFKAR